MHRRCDRSGVMRSGKVRQEEATAAAAAGCSISSQARDKQLHGKVGGCGGARDRLGGSFQAYLACDGRLDLLLDGGLGCGKLSPELGHRLDVGVGLDQQLLLRSVPEVAAADGQGGEFRETDSAVTDRTTGQRGQSRGRGGSPGGAGGRGGNLACDSLYSRSACECFSAAFSS